MGTTRKGLESGRYKPLTDEDIKAIHENSMRVFSEIGIKVNDDKALDLFESAGAKVDRETGIMKMEPEKVAEIIGKAPQYMTLYGQNPDKTLEIGGKKIYAGTGGTALYIKDSETNKSRPTQIKDLKNISRLVNELDNIHLFMLPVLPQDINDENMDVNRFAAGLSYCDKHIMGGVYTVEGVRNVISMAETIAGSKQALREKPLISMVTCCNISPFVIDKHYGELAREVASQGLPVVTPAEPLCGATAPITLAGNLVVQNVDTLAGVMLTQLVNPGTPVFYGCISTVADMKDMKYLSGAVEMGLINAASAQMAGFYNLPIYATAGMSDSKTVDAQAGYESAITSLLTALSTGNFIHDAAGFLEFCKCVSLEKYVTDNEILGMVMRAVEGVKVNTDTMSFDLLKKVGPRGQFASSRQTRKLMRKEIYMPTLSDRSNRDAWIENGALDTQKRALNIAQSILNKPEKVVYSDEVKQQIKKNIKGIHENLI